MSRNFELLQQAGIGLPGGFPGRLDGPAIAIPGRNAKVKGEDRAFVASLEPADLDRAGREETLRLVQSVFLLQSPTGKGSVVVFASVDSGSGCSTVCKQAARVLAESVPGSVCLADANFRETAPVSAFGASQLGLADALRSSAPIREFAKQVQRENLWLLSCGSQLEQSVGLLHSDRMKKRVADLREEFDYVLIDAPALNSYSDGVALGQFADGLVLILEANTTRRDATSRIAERLHAMQVRVLGAVLNKRTFPIPASLYRRL
jgi:Mrp family chromosome partitioning ATPase